MAAREIMTIQIRDGIDLDFDEIDRNTNTPRTRIGWDDALAALEAVDPRAAREELWHRSSGWWKLEPGRAIRCDLAIVIDPNRIVRCVAHIDGVIKGGDYRLDRIQLLGSVAGPEYDPWYGKLVQRNASKNPIAYIDEQAILPPKDVTGDTSVIYEDKRKATSR